MEEKSTESGSRGRGTGSEKTRKKCTTTFGDERVLHSHALTLIKNCEICLWSDVKMSYTISYAGNIGEISENSEKIPDLRLCSSTEQGSLKLLNDINNQVDSSKETTYWC